MSTKATVFHGDWWHIYHDLREEINDGKYGVYIQVDHQGEVFVPEEFWSDMQEQIRLAAPATRQQAVPAESGEPDDPRLVWLLDGAELERHDDGAEWVIRIPLDDPAGLDKNVWQALSHAMEAGL